jgi:hypothetical protein
MCRMRWSNKHTNIHAIRNKIALERNKIVKNTVVFISSSIYTKLLILINNIKININ